MELAILILNDVINEQRKNLIKAEKESPSDFVNEAIFNINTHISELNSAIKILEANGELRNRTLLDKIKGFVLCRKNHTVSKVHPKYPSKYCSVCNKHRSEF